MKIHIVKTGCGSFGISLVNCSFMTIIYGVLLYALTQLIFYSLIKINFHRYLSFATYFIPFIIVSIIESKIIPKIYRITKKRRICIYGSMFICSLIHSSINFIYSKDISTDGAAFFRVLFMFLCCLIAIIRILRAKKKI